MASVHLGRRCVDICGNYITSIQKGVDQNSEPVRSVDKIGLQLNDTTSQQKDPSSTTFEQQFDNHSRSPIQIQREADIRKELKDRGIGDDAEKVKLLIRALATQIIETSCESISAIIFASQLQLMLDMNALPGGMKWSDVEGWYETNIRPHNPDLKDFLFEQYIGFLMTQGLISQNGDILEVSDFGREFLQFLVRSRKTHRRIN